MWDEYQGKVTFTCYDERQHGAKPSPVRLAASRFHFGSGDRIVPLLVESAVRHAQSIQLARERPLSRK